MRGGDLDGRSAGSGWRATPTSGAGAAYITSYNLGILGCGKGEWDTNW